MLSIEVMTGSKQVHQIPRMSSLPVISVVTPSFNQASYLEATINSILNQNYPNLQYVIIDGGSTDGSLEIIQKYSDHLHYWESKADGGHAEALNHGFSKTSGDIMAWLNSDDKYFPWTLQTVAEIFQQFEDVSWIVGTNSWWHENGILRETRLELKNIYDYLIGNYAWIQQESVFWRRALWEDAGAKVDESYQFMVDGELWCRFFELTRLYHVHAVLGGYRIHDHNRAAKNIAECEEEMRLAIDVLRGRCTRFTLSNSRKLSNIRRLLPTSLSEYSQEWFGQLSWEAAHDHINRVDGSWTKEQSPYPLSQPR